jgi:hypothetical protein
MPTLLLFDKVDVIEKFTEDRSRLAASALHTAARRSGVLD